MKKTKVFVSAIVALALLVPCFTFGADAATKQEISGLVDFSSGSGYSEISIDKMFDEMLSLELTESEKAFFETNDITLRYNQTVTAADVTCVSDNESITVTAKSKSYKAANGATVEWVPTLVTLEQTSKEPVGGKCTFALGSDSQSGYYNIKVTYKATVTLSSEALKSISDYCYDLGTAAQKLKDDYAKAKQEYDAALKLYNDAKADYNQKLDVYNKYLSDYAAYLKEMDAYTEYITKKSIYDQQYQAYVSYGELRAQYELDLAAYNKLYASYADELDAYNKYLAAASEANKAIEGFNSVFVSDSQGCMMHATLNGNTVATVVERKSELVSAGANGADVDNADKATKALIKLTNDYAAIKDPKDKFIYYQNNYSAILDNFKLLYSSLSSLFSNVLVRKALDKQGKFQRFQQFLSQLYVITTSLDDTVTRDTGWVVSGIRTTDPTKSYKDLVEAIQIIPDTNKSNPAGMSYPDTVKKPELPDPPVEPEVVQKPEKTWTVEYTSAPTAPKEVAKPTEPKKSDYVGSEPKAPDLTADQIKFASEIEDKTLKKRSITKSGSLTLTAEVSVKHYKSNQYSVIFYDSDKTTVLYETVVSGGSSVSYSGKTPAKQSDKKFTYTFAGWTDADGKAAKFDNITSPMYYYASYAQKDVLYNVSWTVNGKTTKQQYKYGETPTPPTIEQSYVSGGFTYTFEGWSPAVEAVTKDASYTAEYSSVAGVFTVTFKIGDKTYTQQVTAGNYPTTPDFTRSYLEGDYIYTFKDWDTRLSRVKGDATYTAVFQKSLIATLPDGTAPQVGFKDGGYIINAGSQSSVDFALLKDIAAGEGQSIKVIFSSAEFDLGTGTKVAKITCLLSGTSCKIELFDAEGKECNGASVQIALLASSSVTELPQITYNGTEVTASMSDGYIYFPYCGNGFYLMSGGNTISVTPCVGGIVELSAYKAAAGDSVQFVASPSLGYKFVKATITYISNGETVTEDVGATFTMPNAEITLTITFEKCIYTVTFLDYSGAVISEAQYEYGVDPVVPDEPTRPDESNLSYAFSGWSPAVVPVTGDVTYTPVFTAGIKGTSEDTYVSPHNSNLLFGVILPIFLCVLGVAVVVAIVIMIIKKKRKNVK